MVDDRPDETGSLPTPERSKRAPPTIDLEATEVTDETRNAAGDAPRESAPETSAATPDPGPNVAPISPWLIAPLSGAVAAALVIGVGWMLGWPAVQPATSPGSQVNNVIDGLTARIAGIEAKAGKPAADAVTLARLDGLEKSLAGLRGELTSTRAQSEKLAIAVDEAKAGPHDGVAPPDLSAISQRLAAIEGTLREQATDSKADAKPADDAPLRRVVAAALLDLAVKQGDPFAPSLAAAKPLAENAEMLKPLEGFAASGVPSANMLCRELAEIAPKLAPPAPEGGTTGSGIVDRLQAGAAKLVRIQRTDAAGSDRGGVVGRLMAAALRNDLDEARRELKALSAADRGPAQAWLDKTDAREAALGASRKFAGDAMAALAPVRQ